MKSFLQVVVMTLTSKHAFVTVTFISTSVFHTNVIVIVPLCLQAFGYLVDSQLLSAVEEAQLLEALPFHASDVLIKEMYSVRLNKVWHMLSCDAA